MKYYDDENNGNRTLGLTALEKIEKDEMVAVFSDCKLISADTHYIRHSSQPTCYVLGNGEVYASGALEQSSELTLDFDLLKDSRN